MGKLDSNTAQKVSFKVGYIFSMKFASPINWSTKNFKILSHVFLAIDIRSGLQTSKSKHFSTNVIKILLPKTTKKKTTATRRILLHKPYLG